MDINRCTSKAMKIQLKYFIFSPCTWRIKLLVPQKPKLFCQFQVKLNMLGTYLKYVDAGREEDGDYDDGEPSDKD